MPASSEALADVVLPAGVDLHARPAAEFVRTAMGFKACIVIRFGDREANAKSLLAVLGLGAKAGSALSLRADGGDAVTAVEALRGCVAGLH
jgi:phosphotransferase system HPr (HPr) family protein